MDSISENNETKRKYSKISIEKRLKLIQLIANQGYSIAKASRRLCVKASTARMIFNRYQKTGQFCTKSGRIKAPFNIKEPERPSSEVLQHVSAKEITESFEKAETLEKIQQPELKICVPEETRNTWVYIWIYPEYSMGPYFFK